MRLPAAAITLVDAERREDLRRLVIAFADSNGGQSWSFEYTDRIALM